MFFYISLITLEHHNIQKYKLFNFVSKKSTSIKKKKLIQVDLIQNVFKKDSRLKNRNSGKKVVYYRQKKKKQIQNQLRHKKLKV